MTPRLDIYPHVDPPTDNPAWADIERLALTDHAARAMVSLVYRGDVTREQALIALVFHHYNGFAAMYRMHVDDLLMRPSAPFVIPVDAK